jgi:DNA-binding XRE family transcriptional regulator
MPFVCIQKSRWLHPSSSSSRVSGVLPIVCRPIVYLVCMLAPMGTSARRTKARSLLALNVRAMREERGLSQEKLAELAELHRTYLSSVERCQRNIGIDGVARIAQALKVRIADLFSE